MLGRSSIFFVLMGMILGFVIFHPYTMVVYTVLHGHDPSIPFHATDLKSQLLLAFNPTMLPMAIAFVVFGGAVGLLVGAAIDKTKKLAEAETERKRSEIALETLEQLMVTLSHYLLNANMVIGGKARRCQKKGAAEDILPDLKMIEEQARKIDAVMKSLKKITEIKTTLYSTGRQTLMIDIAREIENELDRDLQSN